MAYRKLKFGDHVRIVDKDSIYHGRDAIVINEINEHWNRVQINQGREAVESVFTESECVDFPNKNLLVRDDAFRFIKDGVLDHVAQSAHRARFESNFKSRNDVDTDEDDEYDGWDVEDFIYRIKELEKVIDDYKNNRWF